MADSKKIQNLVKQAKAGKGEAFGKVYDLLVSRVFRFALWRVGNRQDAEDITEEVFLKAWQALGSYEEKGPPFEAWLFKICRNKVIDHYRTKKQLVSIDSLASLADSRKSPEEIAQVNLEMSKVFRNLVKIKNSYQEIIILKFIEEKENEEISTILGKPKDHVRVLQSRALRALKKAIKDDQ